MAGRGDIPVKRTDRISVLRRKLLLGSSSLLALGPVAAASLPGDGTAMMKLSKGMVVYREAESRSVVFAAALQEAGITPVLLQHDVIRQWRKRELNNVLEGALPIYGLTDWSDFQLLRGLAGEHRRHPGAVEVHPRQALDANERHEWIVQRAMGLLESGNQKGSMLMNGNTGGHRAALLSWVIT